MSETITIKEIKELIEENKVQPQALFSKEQLLSDPSVVLYIQKAIEEGKIPERDKLKLDEEAEKKKAEEEKKAEDEIKKEESDMIPGDDKPILTPGERKQQEIDNEFIPDDGKPGDDDDLIPD